ncbi:hypothetical protein LJ774_004180 [Vibrio parahaemolyticus]|nr:hypothetical protein [Vibrio parahaemolyticus]EGQ9712034.1 hypothetical protein [Vibrio parahaemolyticus]EGQ9798856.1 hypothetical protein [Vibrio parahaemolyticus]EIA0900774.1 hypothetical protein [Vibrio parahaemolyticus]EIK4818593.1 hypothetical protein [Vibrio parahaemolyticus]
MKTRLSARSCFFFCLLVLNAIPSWAHETSKNLIIQTSPLSSWNDSFKKNKKDWEIQLKVGGWSHHKYKSDVKVDFNQSHNGLGIALYKKVEGLNILSKVFDAYSYELFYMKDSFRMGQVQASTTLYKRFDPNLPFMRRVELDLMFGVMSRSDGIADLQTGEIYSRERITFPFALPGLTWYVDDIMHFDLTHIPRVKGINNFPTTFVRAGFSF